MPSRTKMEDGHMKTWEECTRYFNVDDERGLSPSQVEKNREKYGPNGKWEIHQIILYCSK